jgi:hypothetical protein
MILSLTVAAPSREKRLLAALVLAFAISFASHAHPPAPVKLATDEPFRLTRFDLPGPVAGVVAHVNLTHPKVAIKVALADSTDPDGEGPCVGTLDTVTGAARRLGWDVTMNASFFSVPKDKQGNPPKTAYVMGHCGRPVGWHVSASKLLTQPTGSGLRSTVIIDSDGKVTLKDKVEALPEGTRFAVSGNAMMLKAGAITSPERDTARHPRSAVGLSEDGKTVLLMVVDGRQAASRGVTLAELADILKQFGAHDGVNLDGGGSTAMVVRDPKSQAMGLVNQPSEEAQKLPFRVERPIADVIGVEIGK